MQSTREWAARKEQRIEKGSFPLSPIALICLKEFSAWNGINLISSHAKVNLLQSAVKHASILNISSSLCELAVYFISHMPWCASDIVALLIRKIVRVKKEIFIELNRWRNSHNCTVKFVQWDDRCYLHDDGSHLLSKERMKGWNENLHLAHGNCVFIQLILNNCNWNTANLFNTFGVWKKKKRKLKRNECAMHLGGNTLFIPT